ncbi:hypothetical protein AYO44_09700 [Planctomycetaceae bacterium SCGC AG-212-F19]|nr:hypothetical protein AYO44_09700 [Planctomycetaceae bacterium SCGC AG-212-F19]
MMHHKLYGFHRLTGLCPLCRFAHKFGILRFKLILCLTELNGMRPPLRDTLSLLFLTAVTLTVFGHVCANDFINYDDTTYVTANPYLKRGFTPETLTWAWTDFTYCMWNPVTRISLLVDHALYGMDPWGYHLTNLLLHLGNVLLLYGLLRWLSAMPLRSLVVAALFAVHPLRVESVAWVAERKDVLSTFLGLITIALYVRYTQRPTLARSLAMAFAYLLSLLAKPLLVTLPFLLLLLDYWPLRRFRLGEAALPTMPGPSNLFSGRRGMSGNRPIVRTSDRCVPEPALPCSQLLREKWLIAAIALVFCIITMINHKQIGAMSALESVPLPVRAVHAVVAYGQYLKMTVCPLGLTLHYPHPRSLPGSAPLLGAGLLLAAISWVVLRSCRARPYLAVGWLWFLGTLVPVIGLVPNNDSAFADRYTYVPHIGLILGLTWAAADLLSRVSWGRIAGVTFAGLLLTASSVLSWNQTHVWQSGETLWAHAMTEAEDTDGMFHDNYGVELLCQGKLTEAKSYFEEALRINPRCRSTRVNMGAALLEEGNLDEAAEYLNEAIRLDLCSMGAHAKLAEVLHRQGKLAEADAHFAAALRLKPNAFQVYLVRGELLEEMGKSPEAEDCFATAVRLDPASGFAQMKLGSIRCERGNVVDGNESLAAALCFAPGDAEIQGNVGTILARQGRLPEAIALFREALRLRPDFAIAAGNLGAALSELGDHTEAEQYLREAVRLDPTNIDAHFNLGKLLGRRGRFTEAAGQFQEIIRLRPDDEEAQSYWRLALEKQAARAQADHR